MTARLACSDLAGGWGSLTAFRDVDLAIEPGCVHAVLGPNGAGKTTLLMTLAGLLPTHAGEIALDGVALKSGQATAISKAGIVLVPDNRALFTTLSVEENLRVASGRRGSDPKSMLDLFPALEPRWSLRAGALSGGEQQMLAIARGLIQQPKVLLVDELSMGLAPIVVERLFEAIEKVAAESDCTVVFVEQYVALALEVADSVTVLNRGALVMSGSAEDVASQPQMVEDAYLGAVDTNGDGSGPAAGESPEPE
jgi:branched-chain amino acid transport system ATP-binding protein